jgi:hypothetical protein
MDARLGLAALLLAAAPAVAFDHAHSAWDALVKKHVVLIDGAKASQLRYAGMAAERTALQGYLKNLSSVTQGEFDSWGTAEQVAFLVNAYNAFTVAKVLQRYPDLGSIRDFGRVFGNPFKDEFFTLLGRRASLDWIEHETLRKRYREPRLHYALNCAAVSCPMLREEAYVGARLEAQLESQALRFLSDASRNRYRYRDGRLEVSKIFDWYGEDFGELPRYFARYAGLLGMPADARPRIVFLDYDWALNDSPSSSPR